MDFDACFVINEGFDLKIGQTCCFDCFYITYDFENEKSEQDINPTRSSF